MKFVSERYPQLMVGLPNGGYVRFVDGEADATGKAEIDAVKAVAGEFGIKAASSKSDKSE